MMLSRGDGAALAATLALATVGGVAASALHLPLGYMLGAIVW